MARPLPSPSHRFHAPGAAGASVVLSAEETHHLAHVLRLKPGADVIVFDGAGVEWRGRVNAIGRSGASIDLVETRQPVAEPPVHVTLAIGLLKGAQLDAVVRDATMLGASAIVPFISAHVAVSDRARPDRSPDQSPNRAEVRWTRVAVASAKQCARAVVPEIRPLVRFHDLIARPEFDARIACVEPSRASAVATTPPARPTRALVCVGPEGGWATEEIDLATRHGATFLSLGPRTLRAESAPAVALASLWTIWGWR